MTYIKYKDYKMRNSTMDMIHTAKDILSEYKAQGYTLTIRQLYYQFVSRDLISNTEKSYKKMISAMTKGRLAGLISWTAIEDRNRSTTQWASEEDEYNVLSGIEYGLSFDQWKRQDHYVEVWVEKDALSSVIRKPCSDYEVPYLACKGYLSASEAWRAGQRFEQAIANGKNCVLIHLGDHDPSGIDMTRDNQDRIDLFTANMGVDLRRIALNMDQVEQYRPPANPAKTTDSRSTGYIEQYGAVSWELDALQPKVIDELIRSEIKSLIDFDIWDAAKREESEKREVLASLSENWDEIREHIVETHL